MYIEFVIIYILLAISIALGVANMIIALRKGKSEAVPRSKEVAPQISFAAKAAEPTPAASVHNNTSGGNFGVAFCTKCAHQFPANEKYCPYCGTPRN